MWTGFGGTGSFGYTTQDVSQLGGTLNNRVRSVWNRTGSNVAIFGGPSYTDLCSTIGPGTQRNLAGTAVDSISSVNVNASC
jgi:hypothetical protein